MRVMRTFSLGLNPAARCRQDGCIWDHPESREARDRAKQHVKATGHPVTVETVTRDVYEVVDR